MNKIVAKQLSRIFALSDEIHHDLMLNQDLDGIAVKMEKRNQLVINIMDQSDEETKKEILAQCLVIRDQEEELLIPYRKRFEEVKLSLIQLNQAQEYSCSE